MDVTGKNDHLVLLFLITGAVTARPDLISWLEGADELFNLFSKEEGGLAGLW